MIIKDRLDEYLEFDSDLLFEKPIDLCRIFGGAIRDIIANMPINDIDILCASKSNKILENILKQNGYSYMDSIVGKDIIDIYRGNRVINEPKTFIKGNKIVQVIRPSSYEKGLSPEKSFRFLIQNVDISCCGVSYDGNLYQNYPCAISDCLLKTFTVNKSSLMYNSNRINSRKYKLMDRGWKFIEKKDEIREKRIEGILNSQKIDYIDDYVYLKDYLNTKRVSYK